MSRKTSAMWSIRQEPSRENVVFSASIASLSLFPQVSAGEPHKHVFQAGLARGQMLQLTSLFSQRFQECWNCQVRLLHIEREHAVVLAHGFNARQRAPDFERGAV